MSKEPVASALDTTLAAWRALCPAEGLTLAEFASRAVKAAEQCGGLTGLFTAEALWQDEWLRSSELARSGLLRVVGRKRISDLYVPVAAWHSSAVAVSPETRTDAQEAWGGEPHK